MGAKQGDYSNIEEKCKRFLLLFWNVYNATVFHNPPPYAFLRRIYIWIRQDWSHLPYAPSRATGSDFQNHCEALDSWTHRLWVFLYHQSCQRRSACKNYEYRRDETYGVHPPTGWKYGPEYDTKYAGARTNLTYSSSQYYSRDDQGGAG